MFNFKINKKAQSKIKTISLVLLFFSIISLIGFYSVNNIISAQEQNTILNMPVGESSGNIVNIDGTELKVTWERMPTSKFSEERFILDVSQTNNSATKDTTYTINTQLL